MIEDGAVFTGAGVVFLPDINLEFFETEVGPHLIQIDTIPAPLPRDGAGGCGKGKRDFRVGDADGTPPPNWSSPTTSRRCSCRPDRRSRTRPKTSGSTCARPTCRTASSTVTKTSSMRHATPGTSSSTSPRKSCRLVCANGHTKVKFNDCWYNDLGVEGEAHTFLVRLAQLSLRNSFVAQDRY